MTARRYSHVSAFFLYFCMYLWIAVANGSCAPMFLLILFYHWCMGVPNDGGKCALSPICDTIHSCYQSDHPLMLIFFCLDAPAFRVSAFWLFFCRALLQMGAVLLCPCNFFFMRLRRLTHLWCMGTPNDGGRSALSPIGHTIHACYLSDHPLMLLVWIYVRLILGLHGYTCSACCAWCT